MAIVIPSSKTYDRQNPKVRDNVIERIEVNASTIQKKYQYDTVIHNGKGYFSYTEAGEEDLVHNSAEYDDGIKIHYGVIASYSAYKEYKYLNETIFEFPILNKNTAITNETTEIDKINYTIYGTYQYRAISCPFTGSLSVNIAGQVLERNVTVNLNEATYGQWQKSTENTYTIPKEITNKQTSVLIAGTWVNTIAESKVEAKRKTGDNNISFEKINLNGKEYIRAKVKNILSGATTISMGGQSSSVELNSPNGVVGTMAGVERAYIPSYVEVSINGNTVGIDITNQVVNIPSTNSTSKKVYSVEENELLQISNYIIDKGKDFIENIDYTLTYGDNPITNSTFIYITLNNTHPEDVVVEYLRGTKNEILTIPAGEIRAEITAINQELLINSIYPMYVNQIERFFNNTLNKYINGKETATIRCSISDYFSEKQKVKVQWYKQTNNGLIYCSLAVKNEQTANEYLDTYIYCNDVQGYVQDYDKTNILVYFYSTSILSNIQSGEIEIYTKEIFIDNSKSKMSFTIYDQVIPMVYGADGKDYPMSIYRDGSPKVFQVLGVKIYYDGAIWQELSLQELSQGEIL